MSYTCYDYIILDILFYHMDQLLLFILAYKTPLCQKSADEKVNQNKFPRVNKINVIYKIQFRKANKTSCSF